MQTPGYGVTDNTQRPRDMTPEAVVSICQPELLANTSNAGLALIEAAGVNQTQPDMSRKGQIPADRAIRSAVNQRSL